MATDFKWPESQQQALERAYELLGEHFDSVVIIVASEHIETGEEQTSEAKELLFKGGYAASLGLVTYAQHRILNK